MLGALAVGFTADAAAGTHLDRRTPGGISGLPLLTSIQATNHGAVVTWQGFIGPYQLQIRTNLSFGAWAAIGSPTDGKSQVVAHPGNGFLRVQGASPEYGGASACYECHPDKHTHWVQTGHAGAFDTLTRMGMGTNAQCVACHAAGFGLPTGFVNATATPGLAGVQCENCHGPASDHAANPDDLPRRPVVEISANLCGGCHTDPYHPTYDEWATSLHAAVNPQVAASFLNPTNAEAQMKSCGVCHSGSVRLALLNGTALPSGEEAAVMGITCVVCHDAHRQTAHGFQLRNPVASTNFYSYSTSATNSFAAQYDPQLNLCGQCHNARGATWTSTSRPPHHSPQYNLYLGNIGVTTNATPPQTLHRAITNQCTQCHVMAVKAATPSCTTHNYTGHSFQVRFEACADCHADPQDRMTVTQADARQRIAVVKGLLDQWGATLSPASLRTKYGARAWEFSSAGTLTNPNELSASNGPANAEQADIPDEIKQARFNLYLVEYDGSYGVHNAAYARYLLRVAEYKVRLAMANASRSGN